MSGLVTVSGLATGLSGLSLDSDGAPTNALTAIDLDSPVTEDQVQQAHTSLSFPRPTVTVGVARHHVPEVLVPLLDRLDLTLVAAPTAHHTVVEVDDPAAELARLSTAITANPRASVTLARLLRQTAALSVEDGLAAESAAYSMLLAGPEFVAWRSGRPVRDSAMTADDPAVVISRCDGTLRVELNRPDRRNAFSRELRDGLVDALDLAFLDPTITCVDLSGRGPAFCSGGDLDEFGTISDVATAHLVRLDRSVGARIDAVRNRVTVYLHGACIGAGIELPAFAGRVVAALETSIRLPEISMGLIPGAGGTVSLTHRIGRWRTAWLALSGTPIGAKQAATWGLVDKIDD